MVLTTDGRRRTPAHPRHTRPVTLLALALGVLLWATACGAVPAPAKAGALTIGISDSDAATFTHAQWHGLGINHARAIAPWDVALTAPDPATPGGRRRIQLQDWLRAAASAGVQPLVVFEPSPAHPAPPTTRSYEGAMRAFLALFPGVGDLGAWNEPNDPRLGSYVPDPTLAASYWHTLQSLCAQCRVAAGEFAGVPGNPYAAAYVHALGDQRPAVWAFHAHTDANRYQAGTDASAPATRYYLAQLPGGEVWIDEAGAYYRDANDRVWGEESQARAAAFILGLSRLDPRVSRIYYYNFQNPCSTAQRCAHQDRGLISPIPDDGTSVTYDRRDRVRCAWQVLTAKGPAIVPASPGHSNTAGHAPTCPEST